MSRPSPRALVIVLGDLARSPRMLRHSDCLSRMGCEVDLVGFAGGDLPSEITRDPRIHVRHIAAFERLRASRFTLVVALVRQVALAIALAKTLVQLPRHDIVLMQNPPAFPALPIALLLRARVIVDWHNFTGAMLRLRLRKSSRVVNLVEQMEMAIARRAHAHFAASQAIADRLPFAAAVVLDRAPAAFVPRERDASPLPVIVCPTGWGDDEDFSLLIDAAMRCERAGLKLKFRITGDGERRAEFEKRFASLPLHNVTIRTEWLPADDYPHALAGADLGLSLHRSASGADLPMKIPEMLACGVPVLALNFGPALRQQLRDRIDGMLFSTAEDLAALLQSFLGAWPEAQALHQLRASLRASTRRRWDDEWRVTARPVIEKMLS